MIVTLIVGLIIVAALVWAESYLPFDGRAVQLIQAATAILGVVLVAQRLGFL